MSVRIINEGALMREVAQVLLAHLSPDKVVRFWASWQLGQGNYLDWRDKEFAAEKVDALYEAIVHFQQKTSQAD